MQTISKQIISSRTATPRKHGRSALCLLSALGVLLALGCGKLWADTSAVEELNKLMTDMDSVQGKFAQTITDEEGEIVEENSGRFTLKRPGYFYWHISPPFEKVIVSDQHSLWTYDPDIDQVTVDKVADKLMQSPMLLLSGDLNKIRENFSVRLVENADGAKTGNLIEFDLIPTGAEKVFDKMTMSFTNRRISGMTLFNSLGEKQVYVFSEQVFNALDDLAIFTFTPPANVDVRVNE